MSSQSLLSTRTRKTLALTVQKYQSGHRYARSGQLGQIVGVGHSWKQVCVNLAIFLCSFFLPCLFLYRRFNRSCHRLVQTKQVLDTLSLG